MIPDSGRLLARIARLLVALAVAGLGVVAELRLSEGPVLGRLENESGASMSVRDLRRQAYGLPGCARRERDRLGR